MNAACDTQQNNIWTAPEDFKVEIHKSALQPAVGIAGTRQAPLTGMPEMAESARYILQSVTKSVGPVHEAGLELLG